MPEPGPGIASWPVSEPGPEPVSGPVSGPVSIITHHLQPRPIQPIQPIHQIQPYVKIDHVRGDGNCIYWSLANICKDDELLDANLVTQIFGLIDSTKIFINYSNKLIDRFFGDMINIINCIYKPCGYKLAQIFRIIVAISIFLFRLPKGAVATKNDVPKFINDSEFLILNGRMVSMPHMDYVVPGDAFRSYINASRFFGGRVLWGDEYALYIMLTCFGIMFIVYENKVGGRIVEQIGHKCPYNRVAFLLSGGERDDSPGGHYQSIQMNGKYLFKKGDPIFNTFKIPHSMLPYFHYYKWQCGHCAHRNYSDGKYTCDQCGHNDIENEIPIV